MNFSKRLRRRWRLWRACNKLGIKPYPWQLEFALGLTDHLNCPPGRQTGKTMAVMLRLLILSEEDDHPVNALLALACDPDWESMVYERKRWYIQEYVSMCQRCKVYPTFHEFSYILIFGHG